MLLLPKSFLLGVVLCTLVLSLQAKEDETEILRTSFKVGFGYGTDIIPTGNHDGILFSYGNKKWFPRSSYFYGTMAILGSYYSSHTVVADTAILFGRSFSHKKISYDVHLNPVFGYRSTWAIAYNGFSVGLNAGISFNIFSNESFAYGLTTEAVFKWGNNILTGTADVLGNSYVLLGLTMEFKDKWEVKKPF